jgi:hypothetical protein
MTAPSPIHSLDYNSEKFFFRTREGPVSNIDLEKDCRDAGCSCFIPENAGVKWDADLLHIVCSFSVTVVTALYNQYTLKIVLTGFVLKAFLGG